MSKTTLKKELSTMSADQLRQIIYDSYDANPDIKDYFDFFLSPDVEKLLEKHEKNIMKELAKVKWGYSKARTTVIKKHIKRFIGFNPGSDAVADMLFLTINRLGLSERYLNFREPLMKFVASLVVQLLGWAEKQEIFAEVMNRLQSEIDSPNYTSFFKKYIRNGIDAYNTK